MSAFSFGSTVEKVFLFFGEFLHKPDGENILVIEGKEMMDRIEFVQHGQWLGAESERKIKESTARRLTETATVFRNNVHCEFHEGVLVLRGSVPSYYLKQLAQVTAAQVDGVEEVVNWIQVDASYNST